MGNIWGAVFRRPRLVRFQNCSGSQKKMAMATGLDEFRAIAKQKLGFGKEEHIRIFESPTGFELEDDDVFFGLNPDIPLRVVNSDRGEDETRPPDSPRLSQTHPLFFQPQNHQVAGRDASGIHITINVYNIRAQQVHVGNRQTVISGASRGATEDVDSQF